MKILGKQPRRKVYLPFIFASEGAGPSLDLSGKKVLTLNIKLSFPMWIRPNESGSMKRHCMIRKYSLMNKSDKQKDLVIQR